MRNQKTKIIIAFVLAFVVKSYAAELGNPSLTNRINPVQFDTQTDQQMSVLAPINYSEPVSSSLTSSATPTGADSISLVGAVVRAAATKTQHDAAVRNTRITNLKKNTNVSTAGCRRIAPPGKTSCYGVGDGFQGRKTKVGTTYNTADMTIALNSYQLLGQIVVVKNQAQGKARCATVTDTGSFGSKYSRIADLSDAMVRQFGARCSPVSGSFTNMEIYVCSDGCPN